MKTISKDEVKHIANLAKLDLTDEELDKFSGEFNNILNYISQIDECDVSGIEAAHNLKDYDNSNLREDIPVASKITKEKMLQNATKERNKNGYIATSKIIGE